MKPSQVTRAVEARVRQQIDKSLPVRQSLPAFADQIDQYFEDTAPLIKAPYLEAVPVYLAGATLQALVNEGVIRQRTADIFACYFLGHDNADPASVTLHHHQAEAIRQVCRDGRNLVVCSGTGSGKTETFLIPVIDSLVREHEAGLLGDGVRAMILYPMNALVNDQIRRLRNVLRWAPEITFGKFTGETQEEEQLQGDSSVGLEDSLAGLEPHLHPEYARWGFDDEGALTNEVTSRRKWQYQPGHILVTNYSMLERLLLKPDHGNLFGPSWKYVVLDEAHCYSGSLGTEIAWLIRRVKRRVESSRVTPGSLRFLATSATLISDPGLTDQVRTERIQTNFAGRLFPAQAESFAVQFGSLADVPLIQVNAGPFDPMRYVNMLNANFDGQATLVGASETCLERMAWRKRVVKQVESLRQPQGGAVALGDLLSVTSLARAAAVCMTADQDAWNSLLNPPANGQGLLDASSHYVIALRNLVRDSIGPLNDWNKWRSLLHVSSDPSPSSIPGDTFQRDEQTFPQPKGNRLHLLEEWVNTPVAAWSWEALDWLVGIASELAASTDTGIEPGALSVTMSQGCIDALGMLVVRLAEESEADQTLAATLDQQWANLLGTQATGDLQQTLATALRNDPALAVLRSELAAANSVETASRATSDSLAQCLFGDHADGNEGLDALVSLATLAKESGKRTPLLDVRYHQMIRGVEAPSLRLSLDNVGNVNTTVLPTGAEQCLTLGLCRDCGQPFALGYAETPALDGQNVIVLSAKRGVRHHFLHAFIWQRGALPQDMDAGAVADQQNLWLNTRDGLFKRGAPNGGGDNDWVPVICHAQPQSDYPEFISTCPTCGESQLPRAASQYGIITPFEAAGDSLKVVAMEELARQSGPSGDPVARTLPGEGRKLLAFSDSRSGSASLALTFQEYHAETILEPLLILAAQQAGVVVMPNDELVLAANGVLPQQRQLYLGAPQFMDQQRQQWLQNNPQVPAYSRVAAKLEDLLRKHNLGGLLSVAAVQRNIQTGEETLVGELGLAAAAQWRLLQALGRKGRHSLRERGLVRISSSALENPTPGTLTALGLGQDPDGTDTFRRVVAALLDWCIDKVEFILPADFPRAGLQKWARSLTPNGGNGTIHWNGGPNSKSTIYLRSVIALESTFWMQELILTLQQHNNLQAVPATQLVGRLLGHLDHAACIRAICSARNVTEAVGLIPAQIARDAANNHKTNLVTAIRQYFVGLANTWLHVLWPLFAQADANGADTVLTDIGNQIYRLNPNALWIQPSMAAPVRNDRELVPLRIEEHTAQLAKSRGSDYQRAFAKGEINILSCSTTFEMGVDLGDLSCVFLNGMPPSVANYRQRAGRAGRRPGSPSYVLTFLGRRDHDRYFWDHPEQLLFAPLEEPKIYLENQIYRARHCRAEAFHDFLEWLHSDHSNRRIDYSATDFTFADGQYQATPNRDKVRRWDLIGDLVVGVTVGSRHVGGGMFPVTRHFRPLVDEMPDWKIEREDALQRYIEGIDGIGDGGLEYSAASDLIFQLKTQELDQNAISPYPLDDPASEAAYRLLGGPNWPAVEGNVLVAAHDPARNQRDLRRCAVEVQVRHFMPNQQPAQPGHFRAFQKHLLREQTVTWLVRCRVLPKYGFPVDVINLLPDDNDPFGGNVKLDRDLKIGLYEYAPGQVVVADKRRYRSSRVVVWNNGGFQDAANHLDQRWICADCHEPDWTIVPDGQNAQHTCRFCSGMLTQVSLCFPDAFQAECSTPFYQVQGERGTPIHVHTRAFLPHGRRVPGTGILTKESESGSITYINQGPNYREFRQSGEKFSLCHEVRTDITGWIFAPELLAQGRLLHQWAGHQIAGRRRLDAALRSALQAILRATARVKNIEERDIQGLVLPGAGAQPELGFVLFDDSSGGGGAVLDLALTGNPQNIRGDQANALRIRKILETAKALCFDCDCHQGVNANHAPVTREEIWAVNDPGAENIRLAASCYLCLRSHRNQRDHQLLDRFDAASLIGELLTQPAAPQGAVDLAALSAQPSPMNAFDFLTEDVQVVSVSRAGPLINGAWALVRLPQGYAYGTWTLMDRVLAGAAIKRLRLTAGAGLAQPLNLSAVDFNALEVWTAAH